MANHRRMNQSLVINKFITLAGLYLAIQHKANAKASSIDNYYSLEFGSP
jgi:hypothetical protein